MGRGWLAIAVGAMTLATIGCTWNADWAGLTERQAIGAAKEQRSMVWQQTGLRLSLERDR